MRRKLTKKEEKINERYIGVMEHLYTGNARMIKNYNSTNSHAYGIIGDMIPTFKLAREFWLADTGNWGEYFLTAGEIVGDFDITRENMDVMTFIKKSDILYTWKNRYIVLNKGGVFDIANETFWKKKEFQKCKSLWDKKVMNHSAWKIHNFDEFGMSCTEYWRHQKYLEEKEVFMKDIYNLLDEEDYHILSLDESEYVIYRNSYGSEFKIEKIDIKNKTVDFSFNGERFNKFQYDDAYWYIQTSILVDYENKVKEELK